NINEGASSAAASQGRRVGGQGAFRLGQEGVVHLLGDEIDLRLRQIYLVVVRRLVGDLRELGGRDPAGVVAGRKAFVLPLDRGAIVDVVPLDVRVLGDHVGRNGGGESCGARQGQGGEGDPVAHRDNPPVFGSVTGVHRGFKGSRPVLPKF